MRKAKSIFVVYTMCVWMISFFHPSSLFASNDLGLLCKAPSGLKANAPTTNAALISWIDFTTPNELLYYEFTYNIIGSLPDYTNTQTSNIKQVTIDNLESGKSYEFRIRTVCINGPTNYTSAFIFHTNIDNDNPCSANLAIKDNNCSTPDTFYIDVKNLPTSLGENSFIRNINLTIEHPWPADLEIGLISPSGKYVQLFADQGVGYMNVGDINAPCTSPIVFDMNACTEFMTGMPSIGTYRPIDDMEIFYDSTNPNGLWKLVVCDDAQGQLGLIKYANINFTESICSGPDDIFFRNLASASIDIIIPTAECDSLLLSYTNTILNVESILYIPCTGDTITISNLSPSTPYLLNFSPLCEGNPFTVSCPKYFETRCTEVVMYTSFDDSEICNEACFESCYLDEFWSNNETAKWKIGAGNTGTLFTGPSDDFFGSGNYIYIESSDTFCRNEIASITSSCIKVSEGNDCNLSFAYHAFGITISYLKLEVSADNMLTWTEIWSITGNQGNNWKTQQINLSDFVDQNINLRFSSELISLNFGDLALDEIVLTGVELQSEEAIRIYVDADNDGYGDPENYISFCGVNIPAGYVLLDGDCNDNDNQIHPGRAELGCNLIDDNCNGVIDELDGNSLSYEIVQQTDQLCIGIPDGIIEINGQDGVPPYTFEWADGNTNQLRNNLSAGFYQIIVKDASGCSIITDTLEIGIVQQFNYLITSVDEAFCNVTPNGSIDIFHETYNAPYHYLWSNGDTTKTLTDVLPGNYKLTITDGIGCNVETSPIEIGTTNQPEIVLEEKQNNLCFGLSEGSLKVSALNNNGEFQFLWSTNENENEINNLSKGFYTVTLTDALNCSTERNFEITEPTKQLLKISANDPATCYSEKTGKLELTVTGGTKPYDVSWSNLITGLQNPNLAAGFYSVISTDANGCKDSLIQIEVKQPDSIRVTVQEISPEICTNKKGIIQINTSGGTGKYSYFWGDGQNHQVFADSLKAGSYNVTVIDEFECKSSLENIGVPLIEVKLLSNITSVNNASCYGDNDGMAAIKVLNPTSFPIQLYSGNDTIVGFQNDLILEKLSAGNYSSLIKDNNGCEGETEIYEVFQPDSLQISVDSILQVACSQDSTGSIYIHAQGGNGDYNYVWDNGTTTQNLINFPAGNYSISISDSKNCTQFLDDIIISAPNPIRIDSSHVFQPLCFGDDYGTIELFIQGGTSPYQYFWNDELYEESSLDSLLEGTYFLAIHDFNDCEVLKDTFEIIYPTEIEITINETKPEYCSNENGEISIFVTGGTGSLSYTWSDNSLDKNIRTDLKTGEYKLTVTDENGCEVETSPIHIIALEKQLNISLEFIKNVSCYKGSDGLISAQIIGDALKAPYMYYLNDELIVTNELEEILFTSLDSGSYEIRVIDGDGCEIIEENIVINSPPGINYNFQLEAEIACFGDTNGIISIEANGGSGDFEYLWNNGDEGEKIFNLGEGIYACAILDENNCVLFTDSITISQPDSLYATYEVIDATGNANNGAIYVETFGGTKPYFYYWTPEIPVHVDTLETLAESVWLLYIVDANGCTLDTVMLEVDRLVSSETYEMNPISIYPNPAKEYLQVDFNHAALSNIYIINPLGQVLKVYTDLKDKKSLEIDISDLASGQYFLVSQSSTFTFTRNFSVY